MSDPIARETGSRSRLLGRGDLGSSLILIFPLFVAYQVGVLFSATVNGADFVTRFVLGAVDHDRGDYLLVHLVVALAFLLLLLYLRRRRRYAVTGVLPMLLESTIYALTLGSVILLLTQRVLGLSLSADSAFAGLELGSTGEAIVASLGAGVHEELIFRLGLFAGGAALLRLLGFGARSALLIAAVASSVMFSLAHHVGPLGDPFELRVFVYRLLAGAAFAAVFYYRSLAHAVYTHSLYDIYVLLVLA